MLLQVCVSYVAPWNTAEQYGDSRLFYTKVERGTYKADIFSGRESK